MPRANYSDIAQLSIDQQQPAQDERPQKDLTKTCITRHESTKVFGPKLQDFASLDHPGKTTVPLLSYVQFSIMAALKQSEQKCAASNNYTIVLAIPYQSSQITRLDRGNSAAVADGLLFTFG